MPQHWDRYQRQISLPEIGVQGQDRLGRASVFLVGLGGLGSVVASYLCAAGIGHLRIADRDRVESGNLNRQILHWTGDLEREKCLSARDKLAALNPEVVLETRQISIDGTNVLELVQGCQIIVDGTDTLHTRRILNRASLDTGLPLVYGGIDGFDGMLSTFLPGRTPCFECLFSECSSLASSPSVLGATAGVVGSLQALEVIKYLLGMEAGMLTGRLLLFQGKEMRFREVRLDKNPGCRECAGTVS